MALTLTITDAGRAALVNAQHSGTAPVVIAECGFTGEVVTPNGATSSLPGEVKRIATLSGTAVAADTIHMTVRDQSSDVYTVRGFALYLGDGTLFAAHGEHDPILEKSSQAVLLLAIDVKLANIAAADIAFGDTNFLNPPATTDTAGVVELATVVEHRAGTDETRAATPAGIAATTVSCGNGIGQLGDRVALGWSGTRLKATIGPDDHGPMVFDKHIQDVWRASNDGSGSGLDADLLDGQQGGWYADIPGRLGYVPIRQNGETVVAFGWTGQRLSLSAGGSNRGQLVIEVGNGDAVWRASNDGAESGLDADLLDGQHGSFYTNIPARLGYPPVQQGTGADQNANSVIKIGASGGRVKVTVDNSDRGPIVFDENIQDVWRAGNDGSGSGLDADLLDGQHGGWYADIPGRLGYTPVRQGGGAYQNNAAVRIGWDGTGLRAQVDNADKGRFAFEAGTGDTIWRASNDGSGSGLDADLLDGWERDDLRRWGNLLDKPYACGSNDNGWWEKSPNGIIRQWGNGAHTDNSGGQHVTFPIEFPNGPESAQVTNSAGGPPSVFHGSGNFARDGMMVYSSQAAGTQVGLAGSAFRWEAIGR